MPEVPVFNRSKHDSLTKQSIEQAKPIDLLGMWLDIQATIKVRGFETIEPPVVQQFKSVRLQHQFRAKGLIGGGVVMLLAAAIAWITAGKPNQPPLE